MKKTLLTLFAISIFSLSCTDPSNGNTEKALVSIAITTPPAKTQYQKGDTYFDLKGMVVTA